MERHLQKKLYKWTESGFGDTFYQVAVAHKNLLDMQLNNSGYEDSSTVNEPNVIEEVTAVVMNGKSNSACGFDNTCCFKMPTNYCSSDF